MVKQTVAFGRRADGPPKQVYHPPPSGMLESFCFDEGKRTDISLHVGCLPPNPFASSVQVFVQKDFFVMRIADRVVNNTFVSSLQRGRLASLSVSL